MAILVPNEFTSFALTEEEVKQGSLLTITQKQVLHNQLADCASEKLRLVLDVNDPLTYAQRASYLRGQMDAIAYILELSSQVETTVQIDNPTH